MVILVVILSIFCVPLLDDFFQGAGLAIILSFIIRFLWFKKSSDPTLSNTKVVNIALFGESSSSGGSASGGSCGGDDGGSGC